MFELVCVFLYVYAFSNLPIVKYYHSKAVAEGSKTVSVDLPAAGILVQTNPGVCIKATISYFCNCHFFKASFLI